MLALVLFIPGAYGLSLGFSGGDAGSSFSDRLTIDAKVEESVNVLNVMNGPVFRQDASGNGDLHKIFGASNHNGERAQITADVVNAGHWEYYQPFIYTDAFSAYVTGFGLTATDADSIKCAASATDRQGDKAGASVEVTKGSLYNYWADAYADAGRAGVSQSFDQASGDKIAVSEKASNPTGFLSTTTNVEEGSITGYSNYGSTYAYPNPSLMETYGGFAGAVGKKIASESSAYKTCGYRSNAKMNVEGTETQDGNVAWYFSHAGVGFGFETGAQQGIFGGAQGNLMELSITSSNGARDISSTSMQIKGTEDQPGYIGSYMDLAESFTDGVFAGNDFSSVGGDSISLLTSSSNKRSDRANANIGIVGNGFINSGGSYAEAFAQSASASNYLSGDLAGNEIRISASASNYGRDSATVRAKIQDCSMGYVSNGAYADSSARTVSASQEATVASGSLMEIDATAIRAAREKKNTNSQLINPVGITYGQGASVISGVPDVYQWMII